MKTAVALGCVVTSVATAVAAAVEKRPRAVAAANTAECRDLAKLQLPNVTIRSTKAWEEGVFKDGAGRVHSHLPPFCQVRGVATPVSGSRIGFEVWLPKVGWDQRLQMSGNGGYSPMIAYGELAATIRSGSVAVATNTGHEGDDEPSFSIGRPEAIVDWAHRAVHESVTAAKAIIKARYESPLRYSYFAGCSTGGHQALMSAQRYPGDFDGILAGAPGNNRAPLMMSFLWQFLANHRPGDDDNEIMTKEKLGVLTRAVVKECDALDGVVDGVLNDPTQCRFDPSKIQCAVGDQPDCLTAEQVLAVRKMYQGPRDMRTGVQIYPGYPYGSEGVSAYVEERPGWSEYWSDAERPYVPRRADFFRFWAFKDQNWNWWSFDWGADVDRVNNGIGKIVNANNPDLSAFRRSGGRLIMFMGWSDPVGAATEAVNYYKAVEAMSPGGNMDARRRAAQESLRLYMVPGMVHCNGGPGATNFWWGAPINDARHDITLALRDWVEKGVAPQEIIATKYVDDDAASKQIAFQRPLCVFPAKAKYKGGDKHAAASFVCETPKY